MKNKTLLRFVAVGLLLTLSSCATRFKEARLDANGRNGAFGYRIEPVHNMRPYTNYAAFTGNASTKIVHARAYTEMAALVHCSKQSKFLMIDSNVKNVREEAGLRTDSKTIKAYMVMFACSDKNSNTKVSERRRIVDTFCEARGSGTGEFCSPKSPYRQ